MFRKQIAHGLAALRSWSSVLLVPALLALSGSPALAADTKVACVGDSITAGDGSNEYPVLLDQMLGTGWDARNFGNSAKTMIKNPSDGAGYWSTSQYTQSQSFAPNIVVIMLGTNDSKTVNWKSGNNTFAADYKSMVGIYTGLASKPKVYAMLPIPALSSQYTISSDVIQKEIIPIIKNVVSETGIGLIDLNSAFSANDPQSMMGSDGIHPNAKGYRFIAQTVADVLRLATQEPGTGGAGGTGGAAGNGGMAGKAGASGGGGTAGAPTGGSAGAGAATSSGGAAGNSGTGNAGGMVSAATGGATGALAGSGGLSASGGASTQGGNAAGGTLSASGGASSSSTGGTSATSGGAVTSGTAGMASAAGSSSSGADGSDTGESGCAFRLGARPGPGASFAFLVWLAWGLRRPRRAQQNLRQ